MDPILPALQESKMQAKSSRRQAILDYSGLPSLESLGITVASYISKPDSGKYPLPNEDPFNCLYYSSERLKRFSSFYGISQSILQRASSPLTNGVIQSLRDKYEVNADVRYGKSKNNPWVL